MALSASSTDLLQATTQRCLLCKELIPTGYLVPLGSRSYFTTISVGLYPEAIGLHIYRVERAYFMSVPGKCVCWARFCVRYGAPNVA